jgi:hypothetical protein
MNLSSRILGSTVAEQLQERSEATVLQIGRDKFTRGDLSTVQCFNYIAAQNLSRVLADLNVRDTRHLFDQIPPSALAVPRVGAVALAVLGAAFEVRAVMADADVPPLEAWVRKHADGNVDAALVTFHTIKHREAAEQRQERADRKARQATQAVEWDTVLEVWICSCCSRAWKGTGTALPPR